MILGGNQRLPVYFFAEMHGGQYNAIGKSHYLCDYCCCCMILDDCHCFGN
jgi:hypothetical protein